MRMTPKKSTGITLPALVLLLPLGLTACGTPSLDNPRAQSLLTMSGPEYNAEKAVAKDLANRCKNYSYHTEVANALNEARAASGRPNDGSERTAIQLETGVKQRSLAARHGEADFSAIDACTIADQEIARQSPLSILLRK